MKKQLLLILFIALGATINAQEHNGWEFLNWGMKKDSVEKVLTENKSKLSEATALDANFNYENMNTWLLYNEQNELIKVHQRKAFSVIQNKEAAGFYAAFQVDLIKKYGTTTDYVNNKIDSVVTLTWTLKYTKISLEYNYKYKIIDEFGADSYWVDVLFEPAKH